MSYRKLDHKKVAKYMKELNIRPADIAKKLRVTRQNCNHILHVGGMKHVIQLAKIFKCTKEELIIDTTPKK
jgi:plasmid maintenance system antidote protein VapI